jgi:hypothetical protein
MSAKFLFSGARGIPRGVWAALHAPRLDPAPRVGPCPLHPSWTPNANGPLVAASRSLCPFCREDRAAVEAQATRVEDEHVIALLRVGVTPELDRLYARHLEAHTLGTPQPGSFEEHDALERMEQIREDEEERERQKRKRQSQGVLVSGRIEGGEWVEYRARSHRRGVVRIVR